MKKFLFTLFGLLQAVLVMATTFKTTSCSAREMAKTTTGILQSKAPKFRIKPAVIVAAEGYNYLPEGRIPISTGSMVAMPKPPARK